MPRSRRTSGLLTRLNKEGNLIFRACIVRGIDVALNTSSRNTTARSVVLGELEKLVEKSLHLVSTVGALRTVLTTSWSSAKKARASHLCAIQGFVTRCTLL